MVIIRNRNGTYCSSYGSCLLIYRIAAVRLLSFCICDPFERNANISVAIKSGCTVCVLCL